VIFIHFIWSLNHGGAENFLINIAKDRVLNSSHVICCFKRGSILDPKGVKVLYGIKALFFMLYNCVHKKKVIYISWMYRAGLFFAPIALLAKLFPNNLTIFFIRHTPPFKAVGCNEKINLLFYNSVKLFFDKIVFNSKKSMLRHEGTNEELNRLSVLHNYANERVPQKANTLISQLQTKKIVLYSCRHHHMKGFNFFLELVLMYKNNTEVGFIVVGEDTKKERETPLKSLQNILGQERLGYSLKNEELSSIIPYVNVVISTSLYGESFPNLGLDANNFGRRFVCSDVGDSSLLTSNEFIFAPGDIQEACQALDCALDSHLNYSKISHFNKLTFEKKLKEIIDLK
jgi:glycosyltransferase involved in cell wall biosynthesis